MLKAIIYTRGLIVNPYLVSGADRAGPVKLSRTKPLRLKLSVNSQNYLSIKHYYQNIFTLWLGPSHQQKWQKWANTKLPSPTVERHTLKICLCPKRTTICAATQPLSSGPIKDNHSICKNIRKQSLSLPRLLLRPQGKTIQLPLIQFTPTSGLSKMARLQMCWTCWRQRLCAMLVSLCYLAACCLFSKAVALLIARPPLGALLYASCCLFLIKILVPILTLLTRPAWYDEDALDHHCHYRDTPERMAAHNQRVQEELALIRRRFQAGVRELFFPL